MGLCPLAVVESVVVVLSVTVVFMFLDCLGVLLHLPLLIQRITWRSQLESVGIALMILIGHPSRSVEAQTLSEFLVPSALRRWVGNVNYSGEGEPINLELAWFACRGQVQSRVGC